MKILATDMDRTLLPNGDWKKDENAISLFNELTRKNNVTVVYVTGRNLELVEEAIDKYSLRYPDYLVGDVGTTIRKRNSSSWKKDMGWDEEILKDSPNWDGENIKSLLENIKNLQPQEKDKQNKFKLSYYLPPEEKEDIFKEINYYVKGKFDEEIVYSYDPQKNTGLLDILPKSATKKGALIYLMKTHKLSYEDILFCGDSGNDTSALTAGFYAVMVRNADSQVREEVLNHTNVDKDKIYISEGNEKLNLSGYYTSGVIEGAYHFGFFK